MIVDKNEYQKLLMRKRRAEAKEKDLEGFLKKQREDKRAQRAKKKEQTEEPTPDAEEKKAATREKARVSVASRRAEIYQDEVAHTLYKRQQAEKQRERRAKKREEQGLPPAKPYNSKYNTVEPAVQQPIPEVVVPEEPTTTSAPTRPIPRPRPLHTFQNTTQVERPIPAPRTRSNVNEKNKIILALPPQAPRVLFAKMNQSLPDDKQYSAKTITSYNSLLNTVSKAVLDKPFDSVQFLLNADNVIDKLKRYETKDGQPLKNMKDYLSPVIKILKFYGADDDIIKQYQSFQEIEAKKLQEERGENIASDKDKENYVPLPPF